MEDMQPRYDDEIDLVDLFKTIWDGKWQIVGAVVIAAVAAAGILLSLPNEFTATTEIKPITSVEAEQYRESNSLGVFRVNVDSLQALFIEQLARQEVLVEAIKQFELIDRTEFDSEFEYEEAVLGYADSFELVPPTDTDGAARGAVRTNWLFVGEYDNQEVWQDVLNFIRGKASANVRDDLRERFQSIITAKTTGDRFKAEDLQQQIDNTILDSEMSTADRIAFLREQAQLARTLGVAKNTLEAQTFAGQNTMVASVQLEMPFYLRGYEAIEKEIQLLESREDLRPFVEGLRMLEAELRAVKQDKTVERAKALFAKTPASTGDDFRAVSMVIEGTKYDPKRSKAMILALVIVLTGMLSVIYVLISSAMHKRADQESVV